MIKNTRQDILNEFFNTDIKKDLKNIVVEFDGYVPKLYYSINYGLSLSLNELESITIYNGFVENRISNVDSLIMEIENYLEDINRKYLSDSLNIQSIMENPFYINGFNVIKVISKSILQEKIHLFNLILSKYHSFIIKEIFSNFSINQVLYQVLTEFMLKHRISLNIIFNDVINFMTDPGVNTKVVLDSFKDSNIKVSILANNYIKSIDEDGKNQAIFLINSIYGEGTVK